MGFYKSLIDSMPPNFVSHALRGQMMSNLCDVIRECPLKMANIDNFQDENKELGFDKAV